MLSHLKRLAPLHVYYTTGQWLNPQGIGPDPEGRHAKRKFRKKKWVLRKYHNTLLKRGLYFDVDYDNKDYNEGIKMVQLLLDNFEKVTKQTTKYCIIKPPEWDIVFSGGKGFHVIENDFYDILKLPVKNTIKRISISEYWKQIELEIIEQDKWTEFINQQVSETKTGSTGHTNLFVNRLKRELNKQRPPVLYYDIVYDLCAYKDVPKLENKSQFISLIYNWICEFLLETSNNKLFLDWMVTYDSRRIIRLPQTVNAKTMRICTLLDGLDDKRLIKDKNGKFIGYKADEPIP